MSKPAVLAGFLLFDLQPINSPYCGRRGILTTDNLNQEDMQCIRKLKSPTSN